MNYNPKSPKWEIERIHVKRLDVRTKTTWTNLESKQVGGGGRGKIKELSRQSRTRLIETARNRDSYLSMITLTYPHADYASTASGGDFMQDGQVVKYHLKKFKKMLTYRQVSGLWFLEFQKRGAPHFHFFLDRAFDQADITKLTKKWAEIVGSDCPHHQTMGAKFEILRKKHSAGAYAAKYSSKDEQKIVPEQYSSVGRFWGTFGEPKERPCSIRVDIHELKRIARLARKAAKVLAKTRGYALKRPASCRGSVQYSVAPALRYYLSRCYTIPDNLAEMILTVPTRHTLES